MRLTCDVGIKIYNDVSTFLFIF